MFFLRYALAEIRRRPGRTVLTALGLAVGVALVVVVNAVSSGIDHAQQQVLAPLTGLGTDMTVARPLNVSGEGADPFTGLSAAERERLSEEARRGLGLDLRSLSPGQRIDREGFVAASQLSFPESRVAQISRDAGVAQTAGSLTLDAVRVEGTIPQGGPGGARGPGGSIQFDRRGVTGVDVTKPDLAEVTPDQITQGVFLAKGRPRARDAVISTAYANANSLRVGSTITLGGKDFRVVGVSSAPLGGTPSDAYVPLRALQEVADYPDKVTKVLVRVNSVDDVDPVAARIEQEFPGAEVTTASDLAATVGGSLDDAQAISKTLGMILIIVGLVAAVLIATLLTLSSVSKRTRELGTLTSVGWSRWQLVRQVSGEATVQGLIGGIVGALVGMATAFALNAADWTLEATVQAQQQVARPGPGGPFGFGAPTEVSEAIAITTDPSVLVVLLAIALAVAGGLVAGAIGGLRAARLRPAAALRSAD